MLVLVTERVKSMVDDLTILIIEDDPAQVAELKKLVGDLGQTQVADTGKQALLLAEKTPPDILLIDIGLPDLDGFEVLKALKTIYTFGDPEIIFISGQSDVGTQVKSFELGADDFISKPFDHALSRKKIERHVARCLHKQRAKRELLQLEKNIQDSSQRIDVMLSNISEAILVTDMRGVIQSANNACYTLFNYDAGQLTGHNVKLLTPAKTASRHDAYIQQFNQTGEPEIIGEPREMEVVDKFGKVLQVELNLSRFTDSDGEHYLAVIRDISHKKETQETLLRLVMNDNDTKAYSRKAYTRDIDYLLATLEPTQSLVASIIDFDRFRELNAVCGHQACNKLLRRFALELSEICHFYNYRLYRLYSDIFVLLSLEAQEESSAHQVQRLLKQTLNSLSKRLSKDTGFDVRFTGVFCLTDIHYLMDNDLLSLLETSLRRAKAQGQRGQIVDAEQNLLSYFTQQAELAHTLSNALAENKLHIVLQPKVDLKGAIRSSEALLRWNNVGFDKLNLGDFLSTAESTGYIVDVGYFVVEQVCTLLARLNKKIPSLQQTVSVNLSVRQLSAPNLIENMLAICHRYGVQPSQLIFELTETMIAENIKRIAKLLSEFKQAGFAISIDDFGTGQSNFRYLNELAIDELKIDKSFVDVITDSEGQYPIIESIIKLCGALGLRVVVEGVETEQQVDYFNRVGCDEIQGYYFFKPMPDDEWLSLLTKA